MSWLELSVWVTRQNAPLVERLLQNQPVLAVTLTDQADNPVLEPGVGETPLWPSVCITALFDGDTLMEPLAQLLSLVPGIDGSQQVSIRKIEDQQWERVWLDRFKPMQFGRHLWIVPGDQTAPVGDADIIRLDPGLAFGTGTHPSTRLCLEWIDGHDFQAETVLDYGCGSGVLGIATAIKGAAKIICIDNDPQALTATQDNAARNGVADRIEIASPEQYITTAFDVVLANILAGPLIELVDVLTTGLRPGGSLVLSGILEEQSGEVRAAYQAQKINMIKTIDDGWVRLSGSKL